jgi:hypothetical protein
MDTPTASRSSRPPLWAALIALVAIVALAACSSSESNADDSESEPTANEAAATNDVVSSTEVNLTLEFDPLSLEQQLENGYNIVVVREIETQGGQASQLVWLSLDPMMVNQITFDPGDLSAFASRTQLETGATIEEVADAALSPGGTATWNGQQFEVRPGPGDAITVMADTEGSPPTTLGLAGSATVNGSQISAPYVAASVPTNEMVEFTDTGRILVWMSPDLDQPGSVMIPLYPFTATTTVDITSQPNPRLQFNDDTGGFDLTN